MFPALRVDMTMPETREATPPSVKILSVLLLVFGSLAFVGSLLLWGEGFLFY